MTTEMYIAIAVVIVILIVACMWHCGYIEFHMPKLAEGLTGSMDPQLRMAAVGRPGQRVWNA